MSKIISPQRSEEITFRNRDITLAGTVVLPSGPGPHPGIVFIHGSGPQTRENCCGEAEPFVRAGVASLIYDKRGAGASTGKWLRFADSVSSFDDLANDALAGVRALKSRTDVISAQVGVWGVSQGGWLGPLAASRSNDVAFVIAVSGPGVSAERQMSYAITNRMTAEGFSTVEIEEALEARGDGLRLVSDFGKNRVSWEELEAHIKSVRSKKWAPAVVPQNIVSIIDSGDLRSKLAPFIESHAKNPVVDYDPKPVLEQVSCPLLAIFGELDIVVPVQESVSVFQQALSRGGNKDFTIQVFPQADHGLRLSSGGYAPGYLARIHRRRASG